jgi:hypothetical protein
LSIGGTSMQLQSAWRAALLITLLPLLGACSMGQLVARSTESILDGGIDAMNRETDLVLARAAIPANIKLIEGLIIEDPHNDRLLSSAAQALYGYAFGFVELDDPERADALYARGVRYGVRALEDHGFRVDLAPVRRPWTRDLRDCSATPSPPCSGPPRTGPS